jgi:hypothetical protein
MNDLDSAVEPWLLDQNDTSVDPATFRRWAIKVAILRSTLDEPALVTGPDCAALYDGNDLPDWHVFVGKAQSSEQRHNYCATAVGYGKGLTAGVVQVSWTLGLPIIVAIRVAANPGERLLRMFNDSNMRLSYPLSEVDYGSTEFPSVLLNPYIPNEYLLAWFWYFSDNQHSPVRRHIQATREGWSRALKESLERLRSPQAGPDL